MQRHHVSRNTSNKPEGEADHDAWEILDQTVRRLDSDKVQDCKEDINTLLVFAGLYSAVLTAFLIESYKSLQEDPQQTVIQILRQISQQTSHYTYASGSLNSTTIPDQRVTSPTFHAPLAAICVNVCWFSSLILSLSTASFGMLVQQWLREYLAIDRTVPQERVRIRHFRSIGLEEWKLFEIAAALPLILQISLALFFIGLCLFTASVHPSIKTASLIFVSGWALFFSFAILAPLLSARCPYKTTFLKSTFHRLRPYILSFVTQFRRHALKSPADTELRARTVSDPEFIAAPSDLSDGPALMQPESIAALVLSKYNLDKDARIVEEDEIRQTDDNDLIILHRVDSSTLDDNLLVTMRMALLRRPPPGIQVLKLVVSTIRSRLYLQRQRAVRGPYIISTLTDAAQQLTQTTCTTLVNMLSDALVHELTRSTVDEWYIEPIEFEWVYHTLLFIIVLASIHNHTQKATTVLFRRILVPLDPSDAKHRGCAMFADHIIAAVGDSRTSWKWQASVFYCIADAIRTSEPAILKDIVHWSYIDENEVTTESNTYGQILGQLSRTDIRSQNQAHPNTVVILVELVAATLYTVAAPDEATSLNEGLPVSNSSTTTTGELLRFVVEAIPLLTQSLPNVDFTRPGLRGGVGLDTLFVKYFMTPALLPSLLECFLMQSELVSTKAGQDLLLDPIDQIWSRHQLSYDDQTNILSACAQFLDVRAVSVLQFEPLRLETRTSSNRNVCEKRPTEPVPNGTLGGSGPIGFQCT
ncbi:hypothetical protein NM688_g6136 [Phlebia brevispora]|uniref:Uncharacterized protein n=1 Tax=Phlebia brevispora TaxID=194682 RepID=A0ACC1SJE9_9APHY|nr:hypothetical protein NM688_g6136 [Phlebia brevispora]